MQIVEIILSYLTRFNIPLVLLVLFFIAYKIDRTKLITGFLLTGSVLSFMGIIILNLAHSKNAVSDILLIGAGLLFFLVFSFGGYIFAAFLIFNSISILRKERRDLKHCLTLILAAGILILMLIPQIIHISSMPIFAVRLVYSVYGLVFYYIIHITQYIISVFLCNISRPKKEQDYIIVLGCWLNGGKASNILARRLDKAVQFYVKQKEKHAPPKLVLSGGKGSDEICSEAEAMKEYLLQKGIPEQDLLLEAKSSSTLENMKFSKEIMDKESNGLPYKCIYATNNYHLLRAGIYARRAGLKINGIGAKTAFYYLPNALLREYIAYLYIHLKWNAVFVVLSLVFGSVFLPMLIK